MASQDAVLIDALVEAAENANGRPLERRQADLAVWFYHNHKSLPPDNIASRQRFLEKTIWCLLEITALQTERIQELEGRGKSKALWLPSGAMLNGQRFNGS